MMSRTAVRTYATVVSIVIVCGWLGVTEPEAQEALSGPEWPALHKAAAEGNLEMVTAILDSGFAVDTQLDVTERLKELKRRQEQKQDATTETISEITATFQTTTHFILAISKLGRLTRKLRKEFGNCDNIMTKWGPKIRPGSNKRTYVSFLRHECVMAGASDFRGSVALWVRETYTDEQYVRTELKRLRRVFREIYSFKNTSWAKQFIREWSTEHREWLKEKLRDVRVEMAKERQTRKVEFQRRLRESVEAEISIRYLELSNGATALQIAAAAGEVDVMELLLKRGANIEAATQMGMRPLHMAALGSMREAAVLLVAQGAEINPRDAGGQQPLHLAVSSNSYHVARVLLRRGADPTTGNYDGKTPLDLAREIGESGVGLKEMLEHYAHTRK